MKKAKRKPTVMADDGNLYHGGVIREPGPYDNKTDEEAKAFLDRVTQSIHDGMTALTDGTAEFAHDVEPVPRASVEVTDLFDISTGDHVMVWRVACRNRSKHAN